MVKSKLITAPTQEPITLVEAKEHLRVDGETDYLTGLIVAARRMIERYLNRALITQTWQVWWSCWEYELPIPRPPFQSISDFTYIDTDGVEQALSEDLYWISDKSDPACITRKYDAVYPELQLGRPDGISALVVCGYGGPDEVPDEIKHAMKLWIADMYEHRGTIVIGSVNTIPAYVTNLIHSYKLYEF